MGRSKKTWDHLVDYDGNYGIDIKNGIWPGSGQAPSVKGEPGNKGEPGSGATGATGQKGPKGAPGVEGQKGDRGRPGFSLKGAKGETVKGQKGEEGGTGPTGDKGDQGFKGQKGDVQNLLHFQGQLPTEPDLPGPGNGQEPGDVWQIVADDSFWVWDGSDWVKLSEALSVLKGEKGDEGIAGEKGDKGDTALDGLDGTDGVDGAKGEPGEKGDEADKGEKGEEGVKGEEGERGPSNYELYFDSTLDNPKLTEGQYLESLKGQKGDSGIDNSVLDNYYDSGEVDYLLEQYPNPPDSYDINYMDDNSVILPPELVDFNTTDHNDRIYNKGMVTILPGCTIVNSPAPNTPLLLLNWVMADNSGLRDIDYTLIQFLFNADDATVTEGGYYRRCTPGLGRFSPWANVGTGGGSLDDYYTKSESDSRFVLAPHIDPNFALMSETGEHFLRLFTAGEAPGDINDLGNVQLIEGPGIRVENENGKLKLSTTIEPLYLGQLFAAESPQEQFDTRPELGPSGKTLQNGSFFMYVNGGTAHPDVNLLDPNAGVESSDFCVYEESTTSWYLVHREAAGIQSLTATPHGVAEEFDSLEIDDSDPQNLKIKTTNYLVSRPELLQFPRWQILGRYLSTVGVPDLNDVSGYWEHDPLVDGDDVVVRQPVEFGEKPSADGEYGIDLENWILFLPLKDKNGVPLLDFVDSLTFGDYIEVETDNFTGFGDTHVAEFSSVSKPGGYYKIYLRDSGVKPLTTLAELITKVLYLQIWNANDVKIRKVRRVAENNSLLLYNSATKNWEVSDADLLGNFIKKDGDQIPAGAEHCWMGGDYPLIPSKMCLSYAKLDLTDSYALSDRASMEVLVKGTGSPRPLALSSTSSYGTLCAVYSYESGQPNNKGKRFSLDANGSITSNGSLFLDVASSTTWPDNQNRAFRVDVDGTNRLLYNTTSNELSLTTAKLRLNFNPNTLSGNQGIINLNGSQIGVLAPTGVFTYKKRIDLRMATADENALKIVGDVQIKKTTDANGENAIFFAHDQLVVEVPTSFNRLEDTENDSVTWKIRGTRPGGGGNVLSLLEVYQNSDHSQGDYINYFGAIDEDHHIVNKKYVDSVTGGDEYVKIEGDTMTGNLTINNADDDNSKLIFGNTSVAGIWYNGIEKLSWYSGIGYYEGQWEFADVTGSNSYLALYPGNTPAQSEVDYHGKIANDKNIVNKKFVDDNFMPRDLNTLPSLN